MISAYVLIQAEVGRTRHVVTAVREIDGVEQAHGITGPYDLVARVQAPDVDELGRLVVRRIQTVGGVTRTLTCTVINR